MKALLSIALCWMIFSGCAKNVDNADTFKNTSNNPSVTNIPGTHTTATRELATVIYINDLGWVLSPEQDKYQVPDNFPQEFMKSGLKVLVVYIPADHSSVQSTTEGMTYIHIVSIKAPTPTD